ncbi:hypothetical protein L226DRAFT_523687 [Lentinus tigrinus ALCF2SS1-7]|uniref:Uncharacterized protein n=1 Tax=Lentinus tigrinus ALCF2SS1-6 TaxID=1328759 RepID=A0A5C2RMA7_9APHY|nr:hypothetical protein L227DRAFT_617987 [Lentinus tigrinus ALCF2SS1-6]RPD73926.1 hypothetical protein L226DRAFT_523687 [Lentinus tigrinus ALCF2SS1-7]
MRTFRNEEDTQPRIQNMITHGDCSVLIHNQKVGNAHLYTILRPPTPPSDFSDVHFELYVQGPSDEDVTSDEVSIILDLFYSPPSQPIVNHGPAWPDTAFTILPFDETMSLLSEGMTTTLCTNTLSESDTLRSGESEQEVYLLWGPGQPYDFNNQEIWADDLSNLVIETGDHQIVIGMQPQYEDNEEDWLLGILLNNEEDDEVED